MRESDASIRLVAAGEESQSAIERMLVFYDYDLSAFTRERCGVDGDVEPYAYLPRYWSDSDRYPFLIEVDDVVAGFVLIREIDGFAGPGYEMAEFYVVPRFRGRGVGTAAARAAFDLFRGGWRVPQIKANQPAILFWRKVIAKVKHRDHAETTEMAPKETNVMTFRTA